MFRIIILVLEVVLMIKQLFLPTDVARVILHGKVNLN